MVFNYVQRQQGQISIKLTCHALDCNPHEENDKPTLPLQTLTLFNGKQEQHGRSKAVTRTKGWGSPLGHQGWSCPARPSHIRERENQRLATMASAACTHSSNRPKPLLSQAMGTRQPSPKATYILELRPLGHPLQQTYCFNSGHSCQCVIATASTCAICKYHLIIHKDIVWRSILPGYRA